MSTQQITITIPGTQQPEQPIFVRFPAKGEREKYTGLTKSTLERLKSSGRIETKVLKTDPSAKRGCTLIRLSSLLSAIEGGGGDPAPPSEG